MINFKGNFIQNTTIKQRLSDNSLREISAAFVELDPKSENDIRTMDNISKTWISSENIMENIDYGFNYAEIDNCVRKRQKFYAVTQQNSAYSNLKPDKILGVVQINTSSVNDIRIDYIQAKPKSFNGKLIHNYKNIGSAMIDSLKKIFSNCDIYTYSLLDAIHFYEKNGFKIIRDCEYGVKHMVHKCSR